MAKAIRQQIIRKSGEVVDTQVLNTEQDVRAAVTVATRYHHKLQDDGLWFETFSEANTVWRITFDE